MSKLIFDDNLDFNKEDGKLAISGTLFRPTDEQIEAKKIRLLLNLCKDKEFFYHNNGFVFKFSNDTMGLFIANPKGSYSAETSYFVTFPDPSNIKELEIQPDQVTFETLLTYLMLKNIVTETIEEVNVFIDDMLKRYNDSSKLRRPYIEFEYWEGATEASYKRVLQFYSEIGKTNWIGVDHFADGSIELQLPFLGQISTSYDEHLADTIKKRFFRMLEAFNSKYTYQKLENGYVLNNKFYSNLDDMLDVVDLKNELNEIQILK